MKERFVKCYAITSHVLLACRLNFTLPRMRLFGQGSCPAVGAYDPLRGDVIIVEIETRSLCKRLWARVAGKSCLALLSVPQQQQCSTSTHLAQLLSVSDTVLTSSVPSV